MKSLTSWIRKAQTSLQQGLIEWDRKRIEENELANATRERIRVMLSDAPAKTAWPVQRRLPD